ncbi:MAG: type II toxin-antitoxin system RelE/ParE family toxin [Patescibacteria group bacterium]|nr:type II toxin-antitoxin system RelE/ParE family toxin [Patescibacteria group bacterium]MCL5431611.1 type II toxin-antitoxin system RelE/ParE family toxin [Patescibacteria group bacterium]
MFNVVFTPHGEEDLKRLPKDIQKRVVKKVQFFAAQENPISFAKPLVNLPPATHRFRVGDYRIAFYVSSKQIYIDRVRHRKEVYES